MFNYPAHHLFLNKALLYLDSLTQKIDLFKLVGRGKKVKPFFADKDVFLAISDLQRSVYETMFLKGWYALENVSQTKLDEAYNNIETDYNSLEN